MKLNVLFYFLNWEALVTSQVYFTRPIFFFAKIMISEPIMISLRK